MDFTEFKSGAKGLIMENVAVDHPDQSCDLFLIGCG